MTEELINKVATVNCSDAERKEVYESLLKQISKKPIINEYSVEQADWVCPVCGFNVIEEPPCSNYCQTCGQRLDWSEETVQEG